MADSISPRPKAIVFDLLTALLDSWTVWDASTPSGTAGEGRPWRARYLELTFGCGAYVSYESLVQQAASDVGLPADAPEALLQNWDRLQPWPEVPDILRQLKQQGYLLGIVTNCSIDHGKRAIKQAETGLTDDGFVFDAAITAEESGYYKPVKEAYHAILPKLGVDLDEVLFVAGSAGDVQGATDAGMKVVWNNHIGLPPKGYAKPLREGKTLKEALKDLLR